MAIAFDAASNGGSNSVTELTVSHTCTGDNRILFVGIQTSGGTDNVSGVTYATVAMTRINTIATGGIGNNRSFLYYLIAPATGANNIVVTATASVNIRIANGSYTGARQSGVPDASGTANAASPATSVSKSITTVADNSWTVSHGVDAAATLSAGTGTTQRAVFSTASSIFGDSNGAITPAGAYSMAWNHTAEDIGMTMASFAPFVAAPATRSLAALGVG